MAVSLDVLGANGSLSDLEETIRQTEELEYRLVSIAVGFVGGARASLVTFSQASTGTPPASIFLEIIGGDLSRAQQEAKLNEGGKLVVCYGSLYVQGQAQNVVAYRTST
jgi:hypothetical protein